MSDPFNDPRLMCHGSVAEFRPAPCGREHAHPAHPLGISPGMIERTRGRTSEHGAFVPVTGDMIKRLDPLGLTPDQRERSDLNAEIERITADTPLGRMMSEAADRIMFGSDVHR